MKVIGITGGVGAGKSAILSYLEEKYKAKAIGKNRCLNQISGIHIQCIRNIEKHFQGKTVCKAGGFNRAD